MSRPSDESKKSEKKTPTITTTSKSKVVIIPKIDVTTISSTSIAKIECLPNGVRITDKDYVDKSSYTVCSDEFCISQIEAANETEVFSL